MRTLLFDIDGTLLLTNGGGSRAIKMAIEHEFQIAEARLDISFAGRTDRSLMIEILERNGLPTSAECQQRLRSCYIEVFPDVLAQQGGRVLPGVQDLMDRLSRQPDLRCCVMTGNLHETATRKLEHFGLLHFFQGVFGGDHDQDRNDLAHRTATALRERYGDESTQDMVVIGDTPADIRCGHRIGAAVVAVCTGSYGHDELQAEEPSSVHSNMADVDRMFQLLTKARFNGHNADRAQDRNNES